MERRGREAARGWGAVCGAVSRQRRPGTALGSPPSGRIVGLRLEGTIMNSLAALCGLFLEVTCSMGCQQVVLYLH